MIPCLDAEKTNEKNKIEPNKAQSEKNSNFPSRDILFLSAPNIEKKYSFPFSLLRNQHQVNERPNTSFFLTLCSSNNKNPTTHQEPPQPNRQFNKVKPRPSDQQILETLLIKNTHTHTHKLLRKACRESKSRT